jgi:hypothetical protein
MEQLRGAVRPAVDLQLDDGAGPRDLGARRYARSAGDRAAGVAVMRAACSGPLPWRSLWS